MSALASNLLSPTRGGRAMHAPTVGDDRRLHPPAPQREARSFFPQEKRRSPAGIPKPQADCAAIACAKRIEKGREAEGRACSHISDSLPFSYRLRQAFTPTNAAFRVGLGGALGSKAASQRLPPLNTRAPRTHAHPRSHASHVRVLRFHRTEPWQSPECCDADSCRAPAFQPQPRRPS